MGGFAWVTLATNDSYSLGALVLAHSLKQAGTTQQLAVLVTPGVTNAMREKLAQVFNLVQEVNILDSKDEANLRLLKRPELGITFTKLHCWRLTQYDKCVFLDADTLVLQNCDELFEREELSAAPDVGWPDCFNSGVFVYRPSNETYQKLIQFALEKGSFDGGDQGLLNLYFSDWAYKDISKHLPFIYNLCSTACYSYLPAFKQFGGNAKIIHFIGATKPWLQYFNSETRQVQPSSDAGHLRDVLQRWWEIFCSLIHPNLSPEMNRSGTDNVHTHGSPSHNPYHTQYGSENTSTYNPADDYQNVWDPWDEYDQKQASIQTTAQFSSSFTHYEANQPIESHNTNACSRDEAGLEYVHHHHEGGEDEHVQCIPYVQSHPLSVSHEHSNPSYYHQEPKHFHISTHIENPQHHHDSFNNPPFHHEPSPPVHHHLGHNVPSHLEQFKVHHHSSPPSNNDIHYQSSHNEPSQNVESFKRELHNETHYNESTRSHVYHQPYHEDNSVSTTHESSPSCRIDSNVGYSPPVSHPTLPKECKVTRTDSNDTSLHSCTKEDSSSKDDAGLAGAFAQLILGVPRTAEQEALESHLRRQAWEVGNIDYLGRDSFENIWSKILDTLSKSPEKESEAAPTPVTVPDPVTPIEQPKAPTETPATEDKTPESQLQAPQSPKQEEIKVPATPTPAPVPTPDEASKPEAALEQPADPALTPTATPEESKLLQEQEPPAQVIPPAEVAPVPSPTIETIPEPKSSQELPAPLPESHAPPESPAPLPESPASLPDPVPAPAVAGEQPSELKPADLTQIPAVIEKPVETDKPIVEVKSEAVVEILKPESVVLPATELEKTPEIPPPEVERSKKTVVEPTTVPQSEAPKPEPPTSVSEVHDQTPDSVPVKEIESPKVSDTSSTTITSPQTPNVPELPSAQPVQSAKVLPEVPPTSVPVSEPIAKVPKTIEPTASVPSNAPESLTCPLKAELPKPTDKPSQTTPATEPPKATEESAQTPEAPKKPDTSSRSIKKLEPAVSKAETKVTEASPPATPATPPIEQAKEALAVESAVPETPPPAEAGAAGQPQAPPRKVVKKSGTKKAK